MLREYEALGEIGLARCLQNHKRCYMESDRHLPRVLGLIRIAAEVRPDQRRLRAISRPPSANSPRAAGSGTNVN